MKFALPLLLLLFISSCSAVRVQYDYDNETEFSAYSTYNYYPDMETGLNDLDNRRLMRAIDSTMRAKGLLLSEEPDFYVAIVGRSFQAARKNTVGVGLGGSGRNVGGGLSVGIPVGAAKMEREIRFDFVDSQKDELFWQAVTVSAFNDNSTPEIKEEKLRAIVQKAFEKYPPKQRK
ncbi:hypothetical protein KCTC52924_02057 [Arenibacter antarcticus]|uniref:DUF4136 domain-containing protein n=1 Tax=Arenibacter antarcticus TaxID=2040469 RepID=A0ABW5VEM3_9FLAO|nr:DUF4136 domain-containing protein [Arenibacter sp. H213]MCM4168482.1 DUF4136 domain-containing protein [Arenibacter sp. H213]